MTRQILLIDGQVFQTDARDRGMGRYSARLITSILNQGNYTDIRVLLTQNSHTNYLSKDAAAVMFPGAKLVHLDFIDTEKTKLEKATEHNKRVLEHYISSQRIDPANIDFLIPSPFQEPVASVYPDAVKKVVVFYDLIPYLYHTRYQPLMRFDDYLKRFSLLFEADRILSISQSVRDDLMVYLGLSGDRIVAIDGAPIKSDTASRKPSFDVPAHFVLMPTSDDPRKNNMRCVLGFEEFRATQSVDYKLIVTSKIHESEQQRLRLFSKNIVFTGNLPEAELDWLYEHCQTVLFAPESEGLGLPILEGVMAGKRVVCSSLSVFKEISKDAFYFCDHENQHSIAASLGKALLGIERNVPTKEYNRILTHYNWKSTGSRAIEAMTTTERRTLVHKPRIAIFTPRPDGISAVGKVVAEGHSALSEIFEIDYYVEKGASDVSIRPNYLRHVANYFDAQSFGVEKYAHYDTVLYHIGNSDYHTESIANSLYMPGYVILHDTNISEAYRIMSEKDVISAARMDLEAGLTKDLGLTMSNCLVSVCTRQLGIVTHSEYAQEAVREIYKNLDVAKDAPAVTVARLATATPSIARDRDYARPVVGLAGIIADIKGIEVIEAIANDVTFNDVAIKLFGFNYASEETLRRLRGYPNVSVATNLTDFDFTSGISRLDVFVNFRMKYQGETSLSTLEAMRQGAVVIVRDIGWYSELADDVVVKVDTVEAVVDALKRLLLDTEEMAAISRRAKDYVSRRHSHVQYANSLFEAVGGDGEGARPYRRAVVLKSGTITSSKKLQVVSEDIHL